MREPRDDSTDGLLNEMGWVRALARSLVRDAATAEDLVQETCLAALTSAGSDSPPPPRRWLGAVVRNFARQRARSESARRQRESVVPRRDDLPSPDELAARMECQRLLAEAVGRLDEPFRSTVILRYLEGLEPSEIARRQGLPPGTVRRRLKEGLDRLRARLDSKFDGDRSSWAVALLPLLDLRSEWMWEVAITKTAVVGGVLAMKKTLLAAALVLAASTVYLTVALDRAATPEALEPREQATALRLQAGRDSPPSVPAQESSAPGRSQPAGAAVPAAGARSVAGRVILPAECGEDATLEVFALDRPTPYRDLARLMEHATFEPETRAAFERRLLARGPVAADGSFELELSGEEQSAYLTLRGRTLYTPESLAVDLNALPAEIRLRPTRGAFVQGRLAAAQGDLHGARVAFTGVAGALAPSSGILETGFSLRVKPDSQGSFELRALPVDIEYEVFALPSEHAPRRSRLAQLAACSQRDLLFALRAGTPLSGRVMDARGLAVEGADVQALFAGQWFGFDDMRVRSATSDAEGRFVLPHLPPGSVVLHAWKSGQLDSEKLELTVVENRIHDAIELQLAEGASLAGRVRWEDGSPAPDALVRAEFDPAYRAGDSSLNARRGARGSARSDEHGHFAIEGLGRGPFAVRVETPTHAARRDDVAPGTLDLELVLRPPLGLPGRVVAAGGDAVQRFGVHAVRIVRGALGDMGMRREHRLFHDPDGRFLFEDLIEGDWEVYAEAPGLVTIRPVRVRLPAPESDPVVIVMDRAASIEGRVLHADGRPARGARLHVESALPPWFGELAPGREPPRAACDDAGAFRLAGLTAGATVVYADADDAGRSASEELVLATGENRGGLLLTLTQGARLTGEVLDGQGGPAAGDVIYLQEAEGDVRFGSADQEGRFAFEHLEPGSWNVTAIDPRARAREAEGTGDLDEMIRGLRMTQTELREGESTHVILGQAPAAPVTVHGFVTHAGRPHAGGWITFFPSNGGGMQHMKLCPLSKDGRYELTLDAPGAFTISIQQFPGQDDQATIDFERDIARADEQRLDFDLPTGEIAGLVRDHQGQVAARARVSLFSDGDTHAGEYSPGTYREVESDAEGRYVIEGLRGGSYLIAAGGTPYDPTRGSKAYTRVLRHPVELEAGAKLGDVDFDLPAPASIQVRVLDSEGRPAPGIAIFARDEHGMIVDPLSGCVTDAVGRATCADLAPGTYALSARAGDQASPESEPLCIAEGDVRTIDLHLAAATRLRIRLQDEHGRPLKGWVKVLDQAGHDAVGMYSMREILQLFSEGAFSPTSPLFGPLPRGRYKIEASAPGGLSATKEITLSGAPELEVTLRLAQ
jgi:RNA polymerase sigma-70 factor (ECF subfamily)